MKQKPRKSAAHSGSRKTSADRTRTIPAQDARARGATAKVLTTPKILAAAAVGAVIVIGVGLAFQFWPGGPHRAFFDGLRGDSTAAATFVGSEPAPAATASKRTLWRGSQHKHAMEHATEKSVLGDFSDASFDYYGVRSRFFRKDGKFLVETDGPDGKLATFEVKYTFGVDPLQQYLIEFPDGRLQALSIAWDSRSKERAASAGSISIRTRRSSTTTFCTGPS